ncbi:1-acyl-sn-glycerol-3-phosphate acyltransferase 2-like isoform X2 [Andrographis paniculata]|uniref:1-acyl-sn-glycerol-3-phosphate acyltransferase 2-like isoform X2 n=1 Tax=Andrographis paniculata TaxID=175694 RepID=UPI0021E8038E|nr:1-acyl-sn-glycerol-3-phosphate acyltransferase 2-like isoform X2 [Andrographis paniculata]
MAIAAVVVLPIGLLFLLSGIVVNLIQVELFVNQETFEMLGKEHALLICNHRSDIDWLVGWVLAQRSGCLGSSLALIKRSVLFLPVIGWSMWFSGYIFLKRSWAKDENTLKTGLEGLHDFPMPFWLALFVEGTRFTKEKLEAAQEYAASAGLPIPRNVLIPRTKGFVAAVTHLRPFVPVIYNITVAIPKDEPQPTLLRIFRARPSRVHVHIQRHLMRELPETGSGIAQWCKDMFVAKDALLERHLDTDTFGDDICRDIGRPRKSLLVVLFWSLLLTLAIVEFFRCFPFSKMELVLCLVFLAVVIAIMQILITSTQSERSTPPPPRPAVEQSDQLTEGLLQSKATV